MATPSFNYDSQATTEFTSLPLRGAIWRVADEIKSAIVALQDRTASQLVSSLQGKYPRGKTGNLIKGVRKYAANKPGFLVRSTAPHVHFLEAGTRVRKDNTRKNANRGRVKGRPIFVPEAVRVRATYLRAAAQIVNVNRELV